MLEIASSLSLLIEVTLKYLSKFDLDIVATSNDYGDNAGYDIRTPVDIVMLAGDQVRIDTGLVLDIPAGYVGLIFPRSHSVKNGVYILNTTPVIDETYCGEDDTIVVCMGRRPSGSLDKDRMPLVYKAGERFCQIVIVPYLKVEQFTRMSPEDWPYKKNRGGFGTSGVK
jgi:dUTP pyrophosphatase